MRDDDVWQALAALGPYFAVQTHAEGAHPGGPWRPLGDLLEGGALAGRVTAAREYLARGRGPEAVELRVAASVAHLGIAARLLSPWLGLAVLGAGAPEPGDARVWWVDGAGGAFPLSLPETPGSSTGVGVEVLLDGPLRRLAAAAGAFGVPEQVLRGNTASAVAGAVNVVVRVRPDRAARAREVGAGLLALPWLQGAATGAAGVAGFRRRSCCLIYRASPGGRAVPGALCGDCVLGGR